MTHKLRVVEGGQLFMHRLRMFRQTFKIALLFAVLLFFVTLTVVLLLKFDWYDGYTALMYGWAQLKLSLKVLIPKSYQHIDIYLRDQSLVRVDSRQYINDAYVQGTSKAILTMITELLFYAPVLFVLSMVGSFVYFGRFSQKQRSILSSKQILKGQQLVEPKVLASQLRKQKEASDLNLDGLPLVKQKETSHILVTGTTGSGKTNCFHTLLPQIRERRDRAIVVDTTGDLISRYYREGLDQILNPLDDRSEHWNLWDECEGPAELESFAEAFIPQKGRDPFWETASRKILTVAIENLKDSQDIAELYETLVTADSSSYQGFFSGTDAAPFTDKAGERTTASIRATLAAQIASLKYLPRGKGANFSIRRWIEKSGDNQWLFLIASPSQRSLLRPLISAWLNTAINGLMSLPPSESSKTWFIIDELPSLHNLPSLKTGLAELRKYGGCILAGVQSFPQLESIYGHSASRSMLDLFNSKIMFRSTDPDTAQWVTKVIGEQECAESQENLSFGANSIRDGVSLSKIEKIRPIVLPSEVANLKDLECFVKLPGDYPSTKLKMSYKANQITPTFS